ncbi:MAG: OmpA family protein [Phycisphaerales bacterium]|nr:OmpA family protein [Phycisphaerales bacterium]
MRMARRVVFGTVGLVGLALLVGCGPGPDAGRIEYLQSEVFRLKNENDRLAAENADLRARYAQAIAQRDAAQSQLAQLQAELANLRSQERPTETDGWTEMGDFAWQDVGSDFLFDSGRATLKQEARARIQQLARDLQTRYADRLVILVGHTDTDPIRRTANLWEDNLHLSCARSMTVFRELQRLGVSPIRLMAAGQGEHNPRASNANAAGKQQNRRVTFLAVPMPPTTTGTGLRGPVTLPPESGGGIETAPSDNVIIK